MAAAFYLRKLATERGLDVQVTLLERGQRLGGVIRSEEHQGCLLEWGPENFVSFKPQLLRLVEEAGLGSEVIGSNDDRRRTFVVHDGRLHPLPDGMAFLAPVNFRSLWGTKLISSRGKLRAMFEPVIPASRADMDVFSFLRRRLGREMTEKVAEPLVSAIYGGDTRRLSIQSALPDTVRMEREHGSLWRGARASAARRPAPSKPSRKPSLFLSMRKGMSQLVDGLQDALSGVRIVRGAGSTRLERNGAGYVLRGDQFEGNFDAVVLAAPSWAAAEILARLDPTVAGLLGGIVYSSTTLVYLAYSKADVPHPLDGFGFVVPDREADVFDACTWVSSKFPGRCPEDLALIRFAVHDGRRARPEIPIQETIERVRERFEGLMGFSAAPRFARAEHIASAMPQFYMDHPERLEQAKRQIESQKGLHVCGAFWGGVGLPDCVATAKTAAEKLVVEL